MTSSDLFSCRILHSRTLSTLLLSTGVVLTTAAADWTDPAGDVTLPNADIVSGSANVAGGMVDLRVQFAGAPFPNTATHFVTWFFDLDQNSATGLDYPGAGVFGAETFIAIDARLHFAGCTIDLWAPGIPGINFHDHLWYDPASNTLRLFFPASLLQDDGLFDYAVDSTFGGSFGGNERAPDAGMVSSRTTAPTAFQGILWCPADNDDGDGDGVPDAMDQCPNSILSSTVVFGACDSGVPNLVLPNGCTILDLLSCTESSQTHGHFVRCVKNTTKELQTMGALTTQQKRAIDQCASPLSLWQEALVIAGFDVVSQD